MTDSPNHPDTTADVMHIATPRPQAGGRGNLCGAAQTLHNCYDGIDQAYRASVEGWKFPAPPICRECVGVALVAMGVSP